MFFSDKKYLTSNLFQGLYMSTQTLIYVKGFVETYNLTYQAPSIIVVLMSYVYSIHGDSDKKDGYHSSCVVHVCQQPNDNHTSHAPSHTSYACEHLYIEREGQSRGIDEVINQSNNKSRQLICEVSRLSKLLKSRVRVKV